MSTPNPTAPVPGRGLPSIPVGLATKLGLLASGLGTLFALVAAVIGGDHTPETLGGLAVAAVSVYAVITSRGEQNAAATIAAATSSSPPAYSSPILTTNIAGVAGPSIAGVAGELRRPLGPDPELDDPALESSEPPVPGDLERGATHTVEDHAAQEARAYAALEATGAAKPTAEQVEGNNAA
jgi:hypothetical protein